MLVSLHKSALRLALTAVCACIAGAAVAHPEKDRYGNDISGRIPIAVADTNMTIAADDFRAARSEAEVTGSITKTGPVGKLVTCQDRRAAWCAHKY